MAKLTFQWNSVPKLKLGAEVHRLVSKLFRAEVTRAEHRLPLQIHIQSQTTFDFFSADCIALATHCSLEIQQNHDWQMTSVGVELRVKIAIAAGKIYCTHVGLPGQVRHIAMSGNPVGEVNAAEKHCESGDVVLSSNAWDLCSRGTFKGFEVGDGKYKFFKVKFMTRKNFSPDEFESWKAPNPYPMIR